MTHVETYIAVLRTLQLQLAPVRLAIEAAPISDDAKAQFNLHMQQMVQTIALFPQYLQQGRFDLAERAAKAALAHYRDALIIAQRTIAPAVIQAASDAVSWDRLMASLPPSLRPPSPRKILKYALIAGAVGVGGYLIFRSIAKERASKAFEFAGEHPELLAAMV